MVKKAKEKVMLNPLLAKYIYSAVQKFRQEPVLSFLREMKKNDSLSRDELLEIQRKKVVALVNHAYKNTKYYNELFKRHEIDVAQIQTIEDFKIIPPLTKDQLRENLSEIKAINCSQKTTIAKTSGSTGKVLKFIKDRDATGAHTASYYRGISWHGIGVGDREAMLWGVPVERMARCKMRVTDFVLNRFREKEYNLTAEILFDFYKKLKRRKVAILSGYSSMVYQFTKFVKENSLDGRSLGLRIVKCTSETINDDAFGLTQEVFGCPLVVEYGAAETNIIAFSCEKGGIHLMADFVLTEFVQSDDFSLGPGFRELFVTSLNNYSLPIIRYQIGDFAVPTDDYCSCGRSLPLIKKVVGRSGSIVYATTGEKYHSIFFYYVFKALQDKKTNVVRQFKVYQKAKDRLLIQIVKDQNFSSEVMEYVDSRIREKLGEDMNIEYQFPDLILRESSGKIRDFVSEI